MSIDLLDRIAQVRFRDDVVAVEHGVGLPASQFLNGATAHTVRVHLSSERSAQVMEGALAFHDLHARTSLFVEHRFSAADDRLHRAVQSRLMASRSPGFAEVSNG